MIEILIPIGLAITIITTLIFTNLDDILDWFNEFINDFDSGRLSMALFNLELEFRLLE